MTELTQLSMEWRPRNMTELEKLVHCRESLIDLVAIRRERTDNDVNTKWFIDNADALVADLERRELELKMESNTS